MTYLLHKKRCSDPCFPIYDPTTFILLCFKCSPTLEKSRWVIKWAHFHLTDILLKFSIKIIRSTWNYHFRRQQNSVPIVEARNLYFCQELIRSNATTKLYYSRDVLSILLYPQKLAKEWHFRQENQHPGLYRPPKGHESQHCNFKWGCPSYSPQFTQKSQSICTTYHIGPLMHLKCVFYYIFLSVYETDFLTQLKIGNYVSGFISTIKYRLKEKTVSFTSPHFGEARKSREKTSPLWQIW